MQKIILAAAALTLMCGSAFAADDMNKPMTKDGMTNGTMNKNKFTAEIHGGPLIHVDETKPYHFTADVKAGATHAVADGAIVRPFHLGQFYAALTLSGPSLAELYPLTGLVMPHTAPYRMKGTLTRDGSLYQFKDFAGTVGDSDLHGTLDIETGEEEPWELKNLRKTCATYYEEHVPESSVRILGHSVGGIMYRHYAHRAPLAFRAIMTRPQPAAFSALARGFDGECPCCRRRFADSA